LTYVRLTVRYRYDIHSRLYQLVDDTAASHVPVQITGKRSNAVLVAEDDWRSIQETLCLLSIPGMRESIRRGFPEGLQWFPSQFPTVDFATLSCLAI
jgi:PHD/YefM family antitoxin component YafN of YafNO toxin-antitoxin module